MLQYIKLFSLGVQGMDKIKKSKITFLPVNNGDSIVISIDGFNILIDGGFMNSYHKIIKKYLTNNDIENIDLTVLTHSDSDHIGGIISLFRNDNFSVNEIWFNSYDKLSQLFNNEQKDTSKDLPVNSENNEISYSKAKTLSELLDEKELEYKSIYTEKFENSKIIIRELEFIFLSPTKNELFNLYKKWSIEYNKETNKECSATVSDIKSIEKYANEIIKCAKDNSLHNASSIAFVLKYKENKFLFLGDADIDVIVKNLKSLDFNSTNKKLKVDFLKLSHHGSKGNISQEFLDIIETDKYIISTNGKSHNHPDIETLCLIIVDAKIKDKKIELIFNYPSHTYCDEINILKKKFNKEYYGYELIFADDIEQGYSFEF